MLIRRFAFALCAALSLSAAAFAADAPNAQCPPRPGMAMFTPEQRLMMFADMQSQADTGAVDVAVLRQMQRDKMRAMTDDQRKAYADGLAKRWAALTPDRQAQIKADAEKWRAEHPRPEGMGRGPRPDCPRPDAGK